VTDTLLTAEQVAQLLAVDTSWVLRTAREGAIPHIRLGRYVRFSEASIREWLGQLETKPRTDFKPRRRVGPPTGGGGSIAAGAPPAHPQSDPVGRNTGSVRRSAK
jgi:excisionase family DNA binding protein